MTNSEAYEAAKQWRSLCHRTVAALRPKLRAKQFIELWCYGLTQICEHDRIPTMEGANAAGCET